MRMKRDIPERERGRGNSCERGRHSEEMVRETFQKERDGGEDLPDKERDILRRREERHFLKRETFLRKIYIF